jgi:hypothetical protein
VPKQPVTLSLGSQTCPATTDLAGHASCPVTLTQVPGAYSAGAMFAGDTVYNGVASAPVTFTVLKAPTVTTLTASANPVGFGNSVTFTAAVAPTSGGTGSPTGPVSFSVDGTAVATVALSGSEQAVLSTSVLSPGTHTITANYQGDSNFLASSASLAQVVTCTVTVTGAHAGAILAKGESTCVVNAQINGGIVVAKGTSLAVENSTINGAISAPSAGAFQVCGSTISGAVTVRGATGLVIVGDPGAVACAVNSITGALTVQNNLNGVEVIGNTVGSLVTSNNSGPGPFPGDVTSISANIVSS